MQRPAATSQERISEALSPLISSLSPCGRCVSAATSHSILSRGAAMLQRGAASPQYAIAEVWKYANMQTPNVIMA